MRKDMKTKGYILTLLLGLAAAYACTREELIPDAAVVEHGSGNLVPFTAEAGATQTRIAVGESTTNIVFSAGDQLLVTCSGIIDKSILRIQSGAGESSAVFSGNLLLKEGKTEADLAGKRLFAVLVPEKGVDTGLFTLEPNTKKLTVDFSGGSIDSDLEALVNRTALYEGETTYEARKFEFELSTSYVRMKVTVPKEESDLARDYTVSVTYDWHMCAQAYHSQYGGWECRGWNSTVTGTFHASSATGGTLYMAVMAGSGQRLLDDSPYYDEVDFSIQMENVYKEYGLTGGSISKAVVAPGRGYTKSVTLKELDNEDVLLGQPESVRNVFLTALIDKNGNHMVSKYEAAQVKTNGFPRLWNYTALTDADFLRYFTGLDAVPYQNFIGCTNLTRVTLPKNITLIDDQAFEGCTSLRSIAIPSKVKTIDNSAFSGCTSLSSVFFASSVVESIGVKAFSGCTSLSAIIIPSSVQTIGAHAFSDCVSLQEITFSTPSRLSSFGSAAFKGCSSLDAISLPSRITAISDQAFMDCTALEKVSMGTLVESVGDNAFNGCSSLKRVMLPATSVTSIGRSAFAACTSLTSMSLPSRLKIVDEYTFNGCTALASVTIPFNVTTIADGAFKGCTALTEISLPGSVKSIGTYAFGFCRRLATVYCNPEIPPEIDSNIFYDYPDGFVVYVSPISLSVYRNHSRWRKYNIQAY